MRFQRRNTDAETAKRLKPSIELESLTTSAAKAAEQITFGKHYTVS